MFRNLCICAAGLLVTANVALASPASQVGDRKDFQVAKDIAKTVQRYTRFTIFDDVSASVNPLKLYEYLAARAAARNDGRAA